MHRVGPRRHCRTRPAAEQSTAARRRIELKGILPMAADHTADRAAIATDLERARNEFHQLLAKADGEHAWDKPTRGTRWTNEQLLFHMVFGYMVVARLLILVKVFSRLAPSGPPCLRGPAQCRNETL